MANDSKTNDNKAPQAKVEVNGDAQALEPDRQQQITMALAHNGGLKRIEAKLKQGFDESGFSQTVKEYATQLLRSGEVTTFPELEDKIWQHINANSNGKTVDDSTASVPAPNLALPRLGLEDGAAQVKKELAEILETKKTGTDATGTNAYAGNGTGLVENANSDITESDASSDDVSDTDAAGPDPPNRDAVIDYINDLDATQNDITDSKTSAASASNPTAAMKTIEAKFEAIQMEARNNPTSQRHSRSKKSGTAKDSV